MTDATQAHPEVKGFVGGVIYRRRKRSPYEVVTRDGVECRVYFEKADKRTDQQRHGWEFLAAGRWMNDDDDDQFRPGMVYRCTPTDEATR